MHNMREWHGRDIQSMAISFAGIASFCLLSILLGSLVAAPPAFGEQQAGVLEEIIVTGTRRQGRTVMNSPAPIDVFQGAELNNQASVDMDDLLRNLIPSYNVDPSEIADGAGLVRPATLRGLPPDSTLVLVNGKRRHRSGMYAVFGQPNGAGSQGPDLYMIPALALKRVEVLRDGAAAQYGSDAIAGVLNFILRDDREGFTLEAKYGQYYRSESFDKPLLTGQPEVHGDVGNGETIKIAANIGLPLTDDGFFNATLEWSQTDPTTRSEQITSAQALIDSGRPGIWGGPHHTWGRPRIRDNYIGFFNWAFAATDSVEVYGHGSYGEREVGTAGAFWRNPDSFGGVFTGGTNAAGEGLRLVADTTPDMSGNCVGNPASNPTNPELPVSDLAGLGAVMADPNCFVFNEIFPGGFTVSGTSAHINDSAFVVGARGTLDNGLAYDLSFGWGRNEVEYSMNNTVNPSLGPDSPLDHRPGDYIQLEKNLNADFVYPLDLDMFHSPLNVAFGAEWREEQFEVVVGDPASWQAGPFGTQGFNVGSNGFQGFNPSQAGVWDQGNVAFYLDLEADVTERLLVGVAVRYEDFDTFGDDTNGKLSLRYKVTDRFNLRATVSTGFRAPTPAQQNLINTTTGIDAQGSLVTQGLIPATNPIAAFFGAEPLGPEESVGFSAGFTWEVTDNLNITADYFQIDVDDRLRDSRDINIMEATVPGVCSPAGPTCSEALEASGIPGAAEFVKMNFNVNAMDTTHSGVDVVATYSYDWVNAGTTTLNFAYNWLDPEVRSASGISISSCDDAGLSMTVLDSSECKAIEQSLPGSRWNLTAAHDYGNWRFTARVNWHDDWTSYLVIPLPRHGDSAVYVDAEVAYTWRERYTFVVGAQNLFDEVPPDQCFIGSDGLNFCEVLGARYVYNSPFGSQGGFWYGRFRVRL